MGKVEQEEQALQKKGRSFRIARVCIVGAALGVVAFALLKVEYEHRFYYVRAAAEEMCHNQRIARIFPSKLFSADFRGCTAVVLQSNGVAVLAHSASGIAHGADGIGTDNAVSSMLQVPGMQASTAVAWIDAGREEALAYLLASLQEAGVEHVALTNAQPGLQADRHRRDVLFDPRRQTFYIQHHIMQFHDRAFSPPWELPHEATKIEHRQNAGRLSAPAVSANLLSTELEPNEGVIILDLGAEATMWFFKEGDEMDAVNASLQAIDGAVNALAPFALLEAPTNRSLNAMQASLANHSVKVVWGRSRQTSGKTLLQAAFYHSESNRLTFRYSLE